MPYILCAFTTCTQFVCKGETCCMPSQHAHSSFVKEKHGVCLTCRMPSQHAHSSCVKEKHVASHVVCLHNMHSSSVEEKHDVCLTCCMPSQHAHSSSVEEKPVVPYILYAFTTCTQFVCKGFVKEKHVVCLTCCVPFTTCTQFVCKGGNGPPAHPNNAPFLPEIQTRNTHKMHSVNRDATRTICIQPILTQHAQYAYSQS